jgi:hypothetical protein
MLAPVPSRRRDGKSSFKRLGEYLAFEIDPETGELIERGEVVLSDNLMSPETVGAEMQAVASEAKRLQADPVFHYVITWQQGEQPSRQEWEAAARKTLSALGYEEHQFMIAAHADTDNFHCHLMVNRVHPHTFKPHTPAFYKRELDKALREIEAQQGWQHNHGLAYWDDEKGQAIAYTREEMNRIRQEQGREKSVHAMANKLETHGDIASLESYCRTHAAKDIKKTVQRPGVNWQHIHAMLKHHGLGIQEGDKGGYSIHSLNDPDGVRVKASQVFRDVFAGKANRQKLTEMLGEFKPAVDKVQQVTTKAEYQKAHLKRDAAMREQRRIERATERQNLKAAFAAYRKSVIQERHVFANQFKERYVALSDRVKNQRYELRSKAMDGVQRKALLSVLNAEAVQERRLIRAELSEHSPSIKTYREWVSERAEQGDNAAVAQLRAFAYADKKKLREQQRRDEELTALPGIQSANQFDLDPEVWRKDSNLAWRVNRMTGDVTYKMAGQDVFTDHGRRFIFTAKGSAEEQTILLALEMARRKYGQQLTLTGSDEFKHRVVEIAVKNRLNVNFVDDGLDRLRKDFSELTTAQELTALQSQYQSRGLKLMAQDSKAGVRTEAGAEYRGRIVQITDCFVIQKIGANVHVAHRRANFSQLDARTLIQQAVQVVYGKSGDAQVVAAAKQRSHGLNR